jgi:NaMN:DMB phosphoribosyltransferase
MDNVKATVTTSGSRGLSLAATSSTFSANIQATYMVSGGANGSATSGVSITTSASSSIFGWNFTSIGEGAVYTVNDTTNSRVYRITLMIGASYNNNFICIERLY